MNKAPFLYLRGLALIAPRRAEALAARRFSTPIRRKPATPPSLDGRRFWLDSGAHRLAVWEWGGEGPTILLAHGWEGQASQLTGFVAPLVAAGFHVVAFDQPAHGHSTGTRATVLDFADAVFNVAWKFRPIYGVVGHSLGGTAAALALARGISAERAVLVAPPAEPVLFARRFAEALGFSQARTEGMLGHIRETVGVDFDDVDLRRLAPRMSSKLLLIHDPEDREVPFTHGIATASAWPGGRIERIPNVGHHRVLKAPDVIEMVVRFLSGSGEALRRTA